MKEQYYYLVTSLPGVILNEKPVIDKDKFLDICKGLMNETDFNILKSVCLSEVKDESIPSGDIKRFFNWERGIRNALVKLRAEKQGREASEFLRECEYDNSHVLFAEKIFNLDNPLIAEEILNKARWMFLDELEFGHYFDLEKLVIYFIKLQMLERMSLFDTERGIKKLDDFVDRILSDCSTVGHTR